MPTRHASARWSGGLKGGTGSVESQSGLVKGSYTFPTRFEDAQGTNPEELMAASHAGCYAMAFSALLGEEGHEPKHIDATAHVTLDEVDGKPTITRVHLVTRGEVPGLDAEGFRRVAQQAKDFCPVSRALAGVEITLDAEPAS